MRRPRRWSGAASWISALAFAVKSVNEMPMPNRSEPCEVRVLYRCEQEHEHAERARADREETPARSAEGRGGQRACEGSEAERRGEEAEPLGPDVQRVGREQRHENVEVEPDGRDDRDDREDQAKLRIRPGVGERSTQSVDHAGRGILLDLPELVLRGRARAR